MSKYSEGPWEVCVDPPNPQWFAGVTVGNKHHRICDVSQLGPTQGEVGEANGRLIAAAPDLLEALQELLKSPAGDYDTTDGYENACKKAEAAIAKATGEQS